MNTRLLLALLIVLSGAFPAHADSLPKNQFDRIIELRLAPNGVALRYVLVLAEDTMQLDGVKCLPAEDIATLRDSPRESYRKLYARGKGERMAKSFFATLDNTDVPFRLENVDVTTQDHNLRFEFRFQGRWNPSLTGVHQFQFTDETQFVGKDGSSLSDDAEGGVTLTIRERNPNSFADIDTIEPTKLHGKPRGDLKPDEEPKRRTCSATFMLKAESQPTEPQEPIASTPTITVEADDRSLGAQLQERGLTALLESNLGYVVILLLAALFGAAHAFTPGHGKTMVAAYLIGERGTVWHAVTLGLTATIAHTGSVLAIAVGLFFYYAGATPPAAVQGWLMLGGGALIFFVGLWLLLQRLRGKADHVHLFGGHDHHHHHGGVKHDHDHHHHAPVANAKSNFGWLRVILLGLGGGIIPCWDAVMLLLVAMAQGRIGFAIPLLLAFSTGLAAVMIAIGLLVVYAHRKGRASFGESRWFKFLPVVSAGILLVVAVWFLRDGFQLLGDVAKPG